MPNKKISQLTDGNPAQSADQIPINRAGANFRVTAGSIIDLATTFTNQGRLGMSVQIGQFFGDGNPIEGDYLSILGFTPNSLIDIAIVVSYAGNPVSPGTLWVEYVDTASFKIHSSSAIDASGVRYIVMAGSAA